MLDPTKVSPRTLLDVHHKNPLDEGERYTTIKDFALLCPTCHRVEHQRLKHNISTLGSEQQMGEHRDENNCDYQFQRRRRKNYLHVGAGSCSSTIAEKFIVVFDLDAQMSLTQSIALNEDGNPFRNFTDWYERAVAKSKTIFDALDEFTKTNSPFKFGINQDFIYRINDRYHFVPSVEELYWTELEVWDREKVKFFIQRLLEKIRNSKNVPEYDTVLFDCPPFV